MSVRTVTIIPSMLRSGTILKIGVRFHKLAVGEAIALVVEEIKDVLELEVLTSPYMKVDLLAINWLQQFAIPIPVDLVFNFLGKKSSLFKGIRDGTFSDSARWRVTEWQHLGDITYAEALLEIAFWIVVTALLGKVSKKVLGKLFGLLRRKDLSNREVVKKLNNALEDQSKQLDEKFANMSSSLIKQMDQNYGDLSSELSEDFAELLEHGNLVADNMSRMFSDTTTLLVDQHDILMNEMGDLGVGLDNIDDDISQLNDDMHQGFEEITAKLDRATSAIQKNLSKAITKTQKALNTQMLRNHENETESQYTESFRSVDRSLKASSEQTLLLKQLLSTINLYRVK